MIKGKNCCRAATAPGQQNIYKSIIIHSGRFFHRNRRILYRRSLHHEQSDHWHRGRLWQRQDHPCTAAEGALWGGRGAADLPHDSYYKRHDELPFEERCKLNYDHPDAFDNALLIYHLQELKAGRAIDCPVYDYSNHNRSNEVQHIEPAPVLIVEGILPFVEPELCALFDYKIFVDTDADERILRRILRDVKERGRSLDSVIDQYLTTVKPMHEAFVEPSKRNADIIVPNGGENSTAVEMLAHHIRTLIEKANRG